ncbi:MAG: efflux RND transporter periplasmic adaptor subunit [Nitrospirae bacterium]|nr:efflux RND transporter periplasmic adaptor subunit [Nitrospirota bacterium]
MKKSNALIILFLLLLLGIGIAFFSPILLKERGKREKPLLQKIPPPVVAAKGIVESEDIAEISSKHTGLIKKILIKEGGNVKQGQVVVIIDDNTVRVQLREAEAVVLKAQADYIKTKADYERYERLHKEGAVTLAEFEEHQRQFKTAESELLRTRAQVDYIKTLLDNYMLISPISGVATERHLEAGEVAREGAVILTLSNTNRLRITAQVDETDIGKIQVGQTAQATTDAYPERVYTGKVKRVSHDIKRKKIRAFDPVGWLDISTQEVTISLDSYEGLKIGMTVDVRFPKLTDNK